MKKIKFAVFLSFTNLVFAQNSAVTNASILREEGNLKDAKIEIDKASVHEKTILEPKTWYYKGLIYSGIFASTDPATKMLSDSANLVALNAFKKSIALENKEKGLYTKLIKEQLDNLWVNSTNEGIKQYDVKDFKKAKQHFEVAAKAKPTDTAAANNVLAVCQQLKDTMCIINYYKTKVDAGKERSEFYYWSYIYYIKKDTNLAYSYLEQGVAKFPNNKVFANNYIEELFFAKKYAKVQPKLEEAVKADPTNKLLKLKLASTYENLSQNDKAIEQYNNILVIDPSNLNALYNNGVLKYRKALIIATQKDGLKADERATKGKEIDDNYKKTLYDAAKNFEDYHKIRTKDDQATQILIDIYRRLKRDDMIEILRKQP